MAVFSAHSLGHGISTTTLYVHYHLFQPGRLFARTQHRVVLGTVGALVLLVAGWGIKRRQGAHRDPELHPLHGKVHAKGRGRDKAKAKGWDEWGERESWKD